MALTKEKKTAVVDELTELLTSSKLTVAAQYTGLTVTDLQQLRAKAGENQATIRVAKNRLVRKAVSSVDALKEADTSALNGQLLYAFSSEDEIAPAQLLDTFAREHPNLQFVGAITADGEFMSAEEVSRLAKLPSKDQLRAQLVGTIAAPLSGFVNVMAGNVRGLVNVLNARAQSM